MNAIKKISLVLTAGLLLASCSRDSVIVDGQDERSEGWHIQTLEMSLTRTGFDATTKADIGWKDGDVLYLSFTSGSRKVPGKAVYSDSSSVWTVSYYGSLTRDAETAVSLWNFENAGETLSDSVLLTPSTIVCADDSAKYTFPSDGSLKVKGNLKPITGRIQFKGTVGTDITVGGIRHCTSYSLSSGLIAVSDRQVSLKVQADGYTPYVYGAFTDTGTRTITIKNVDGTFTANCPLKVLQTGKSGWMDIPTADAHKGWTKYDPFNGHEYVDLGLTSGTLWATCNIGASKPEDYGDYFAWGETTGYNSGKTNFEWSTYKWCNGSETTMTKYCTSSSYGTVDNKTELELSDDAARANWGGQWRMPSSAQIDELISECNTEWTIQNGVYGRKMTSKKNGNSVFLPPAGYRTGTSLDDTGARGYYISCSCQGESNSAFMLYFHYGYFGLTGSVRSMGRSVRPVCQEVIMVEGLTLDKASMIIDYGKTDTLVAILFPSYATDKTVVWESSNTAVATVSYNGVVTYVAEGTATITVTSASNSKVKATCEVTCNKDTRFNGHEYVDLGLTSGTLWATCNIGASKPEEYGDNFAWGETTGYNSGKTNFEWSTYKWCKGSNTTMTKYCTSSSFGTVDNKTELELSDDAARTNWGGQWRMPSSAQIDELISECNTEWTTQNGVYGRKVTSKKNGKSIFLPAAGFRYGSSLNNAGSSGYCWSRSLHESYSSDACYLGFYSSDFGRGNFDRFYGQSVRPVVSE